jgi:hypothetical protein
VNAAFNWRYLKHGPADLITSAEVGEALWVPLKKEALSAVCANRR